MRCLVWLLALTACGRIDFDEPAPATLEIVASVAACIDPGMPDPEACEQNNGPGQMAVDLMDTSAGNPWNGYVRFDLPADLGVAGRRVRSATLRLVVTDHDHAPGASTGTVWRVARFTLADLSSTAPAPLDPAPLAGSQGPVAAGQVVEWSLPASIVALPAPICLGVLPDADDGVNYWNLDGPEPPRLVLDLE